MSFDTLNNKLDLVENYNGTYLLGTVVNNTDPQNLDRIQASVPNLYDPGQGDIPWAAAIKFSSFGIGSGWGTYGAPAVGSQVLILLQNGDPAYPLYHSILTVPNPMFADTSGASGSSWGWKDPAGNSLLVSGQDIKLTASSGVVFHIDSSGNLSVQTSGNVDLQIAGSTTVNSSGQVHLVAPNSVIDSNVTINGDTTINGLLTGTEGLAISGGSGTTAQITGNLSTNGTILNNGVNIGSTHTHGGVKAGSDSSGVPQ